MSDHDDATLGRIFTRRQALVATARAGLLAGGAALLGPPTRAAVAAPRPTTAPATRPATLVACPQLTEGPFFIDERLNRSDLIAGTTRPGVVRAVPLLLTMTVNRLTGTAAAPLPGAYFDVWHADAHGIYSDENDPMNPEVTAGQTWLRGYQMTDANGRATFGTIVPSYYNGRTAHIHFKVRQFVDAAPVAAATPTTLPATRPTVATAEFTSQLFFDDRETDLIYARAPYAGRGKRDTYNADDAVYTEPLADGSPAGAQMTLDLRDNPHGPGRTAAVTIYLTDALMHGPPSRRPAGRAVVAPRTTASPTPLRPTGHFPRDSTNPRPSGIHSARQHGGRFGCTFPRAERGCDCRSSGMFRDCHCRPARSAESTSLTGGGIGPMGFAAPGPLPRGPVRPRLGRSVRGRSSCVEQYRWRP